MHADTPGTRSDVARGVCLSQGQMFGTPTLPLLPLWEKGVGGMRGKRA
jgi:hypothetical protein